ncbi:MAG: hypothetical protein WCC85_08945, partial [Candidatus Sulfotelmatobacter sp.]
EYFSMAGIGELTGMPWNRDMIETERSAGDVMLFEFVRVFFAFDTKESEAEKHGDRQHADQQGSTRGLRGPNRENDGQTAANKYGRVGCTKRRINRFAGRSEVSEVPLPVYQVSTEQPAKEHDFSSKKDPHSQTGSIALLLLLSKVMQESGIVRGVSFPVTVVDGG